MSVSVSMPACGGSRSKQKKEKSKRSSSRSSKSSGSSSTEDGRCKCTSVGAKCCCRRQRSSKEHEASSTTEMKKSHSEGWKTGFKVHPAEAIKREKAMYEHVGRIDFRPYCASNCQQEDMDEVRLPTLSIIIIEYR